MRFLIWATPFDIGSGGSVALHRLAHNLENAGQTALIWSSRKNPDWLGTLVLDSGAMPTGRDIIAVYPEVVFGNPFSAEHVVRWILNTPGVCGGDGVYGANDLIFNWSNAYTIPFARKANGMLTAFRDYSHFRDLGYQRQGCCYVVRKGSQKPRNQHPPTATCLDDYMQRGGDQYLIENFNRHARFISYDHATMLSVFAVLCGCESIVIPDGRRTIAQAVADGGGMSGVAWGPHDLNRAIATRHLAKSHLDAQAVLSLQQTEEFICICREHCV